MELAADLRRFLRDELVTARTASATNQLRKFIMRNRIAAGVGAAMLALALLASTAGLIALRKEHEIALQIQRTRASQARLLTQTAAELLKSSDLAAADQIILEVFTNPDFSQEHSARAQGVLLGVQAADAQLAVLHGHGGWVYSAVYSPDGTRVVTTAIDGIRIWDAHSGAQLMVLPGHDSAVYSADFSPDGARVISASGDTLAHLWDARTGAQLAVIPGHGALVRSAAFSPDGTRIVTASEDRTTRVWDTRTGAPLKEFLGNSDSVNSAFYSPDGARIAYELGRALLAQGDVTGARRQFESAVADHYPVAQVDLADLQARTDPKRALLLYEEAWKAGVTIADFRLGQWYERGAIDSAQAWLWYQRAAQAGDPNARARLAEREDRAALAETAQDRRQERLLQAFASYAAAAAGAYEQDWPDELWQSWRYRRASLARILAHDGLMAQVADRYRRVQHRSIFVPVPSFEP